MPNVNQSPDSLPANSLTTYLMQPGLLHETLLATSDAMPLHEALVTTDASVIRFQELLNASRSLSALCLDFGANQGDRVGYIASKSMLSATVPYAVSYFGGVFVPINPSLMPEQILHIIEDCEIRILICDAERVDVVRSALENSGDRHRIIVSGDKVPEMPCGIEVRQWHAGENTASESTASSNSAESLCALLYTSGSTGKPKGVMVSHRNIIDGIASVSEYLDLTSDDRILAALPFSFDYGLNQLTSAVAVGATCILHDYLLPSDIDRAISDHRITGLAGVPTIWNRLAITKKPKGTKVDSLRYFTNSGGAMNKSTLDALRKRYPGATPYLMYGLTEAFRSTYLPPEYLDEREGSMGKPIPGAKILVVNDEGQEALPGEQGELVHYGRHVTSGYWNNAQATAEKFRILPEWASRERDHEIGVWSGDIVTSDGEGFLYFVGRRDNMIKTSGYRVSPEEIEEVVYNSGMVAQAAALGIDDALVGQAVALAVEPHAGTECDIAELLAYCRANLPGYMVPKKIVLLSTVPLNANRKPDRVQLAANLESSDTLQ